MRYGHWDTSHLEMYHLARLVYFAHNYTMLLELIASILDSLLTSVFVYLRSVQVAKLLEGCYCQPPPPGCPRAVYAIMVDCW